MTKIIELVHVSKVFGSETVINDVSLSLDDSKVYGFIGKNGSGKSVLFKLILGLFLPTEGTVEVFGNKTTEGIFPDNVGAILDKSGFVPNYNAFDNLKLLASIRGIISDQQIKDSISFVGLQPNNKKPYKKFSLGMKQRLAIAQAIMEKPDLLVLDEPMNGLDEKGIREIREYLTTLKQEGKTILLASHNMDDIKMLCDEIYEIKEGVVNTTYMQQR